MPDKFQFYNGSADAIPGKGSGEALESSNNYKDLRKIKDWRKLLAAAAAAAADTVLDKETIDVLKLTKDAELWLAPPRKNKVRATILESIREVQRNTQETPDMSSLTPGGGGGGAAATNTVPVVANVPVTEAAEKQESAIRFCPTCRYYLYLQMNTEDDSLFRLCRNCGYKADDDNGGLVMETMVQERSAEGYKILLNEFTRRDPRLPHIRKNIKCPDVACDSNHGKKDPDVIYIKYDAVNLMYLYICDICGYQWKSRR